MQAAKPISAEDLLLGGQVYNGLLKALQIEDGEADAQSAALILRLQGILALPWARGNAGNSIDTGCGVCKRFLFLEAYLVRQVKCQN
jgi:hypothetical protein